MEGREKEKKIDITYMVASRFLLHSHSTTSPLFVSMIIEDGGEGVIMRRVGSLYEPGRSPSLIKLKVSFFPFSYNFSLSLSLSFF